MYDYKYEIIDFVGIETKKKRALPEIEDFFKMKNEIKYKYGNNSVEYYNIKIRLNSIFLEYQINNPSRVLDNLKFTFFVLLAVDSLGCVLSVSLNSDKSMFLSIIPSTSDFITEKSTSVFVLKAFYI